MMRYAQNRRTKKQRQLNPGRCAQFHESGQVFVRIGELRIDRDGLSQVRFSLLEVSPLSMNDTSVVKCNRVVGRKPQHFIRISQGLFCLAKPQPSKAAVTKQGCRVWPLTIESTRQVFNRAEVVTPVQS